MEFLASFIADILAFLQIIDTSIRFHPFYLVPFCITAFFLFILNQARKKEGIGFWQWLFPKEIYLNASHVIDFKLFVIGRIIILLKAFDTVLIQTFFALAGMSIMGAISGMDNPPQTLTHTKILIATLIITIVTDFGVYWIHRIHHELPAIWPFHAVHHSAEVLTPLTVYRKHPVYDIISRFINAILTGFVQGITVEILIGDIQVTVIAGINAFYFTFNFLGANFRHSHIWLSYGDFLEHIFISPAQHQIHHSLDPKHHNKNYGEILAVWDWLFGTLYIPKMQEKLIFGLSARKQPKRPLQQPHPNLKAALLLPVQESWQVLKNIRKNT